MFSVQSLTSGEARVIAEAYLRCGRNPNKIGEALGMAEFDKDLLAHPLVRREVIAIARVNSQQYSMVDHMSKLQEIRDEAMNDRKWAAALQSEMSLAKAAGLYDQGQGDDDVNDPALEPKKLSSDQIRRLLASREESALPAPQKQITSDDEPDTFMEDGAP